MIGKLRGVIDSVNDGHAIIDVGGVGYLVFAASNILQKLSQMDGEVSLIIETHIREDHFHLYGFLTEFERDWFNLLTTVQGVGAKMALAIQTVFSGDELTTIIAAQDKTSLTRANGVGKKVSERIITELKSKVGTMPMGSSANIGLPANSGSPSPAKTANSSTREEAVSALVNLGYVRVDAFSAVARVLANNPEAGLNDAIRLGLKELS